MWKRRQLKRNAKADLKANYWRCVLAALILVAVTGSMSGLAGGISGGLAGGSAGMVGSVSSVSQLSEATAAELGESTDVAEAASDLISPAGDSESATWNDVLEDLTKVPEVQALLEKLDQMDESDYFMILAIVGGVVGVILLLAFLVQLLFLNPLIAGCKYFFARNCEEKAMVGDVAGGYDHGYGRVVGGMFLKSLFLFFWTLLFIIPGIIKSFSYRMVPYILVDQPELTANQAITRSRKMMKGNKWRAFVLDLSFILWYILSALTLGLLGIFFVHPYYEATNGELYQALKEEFAAQSTAPAGGPEGYYYPPQDLPDDLPADPVQDLPQELPQELPQDVPADLPQDLADDLPEEP